MDGGDEEVQEWSKPDVSQRLDSLAERCGALEMAVGNLPLLQQALEQAVSNIASLEKQVRELQGQLQQRGPSPPPTQQPEGTAVQQPPSPMQAPPPMTRTPSPPLTATLEAMLPPPGLSPSMEEATEEMNCMEDACVAEKCFVIKEMPGGYHDGWCISCRKGINSDVKTHADSKSHKKFLTYWMQGPVMRKTYAPDFIRICNDRHNIARPTEHMHSAGKI